MLPAPPHLYRSRCRAMEGAFRQLRHDLASPLSGAALHLEMAMRRLSHLEGAELERLLENVRTGQQEVSYAASMLDVLGELSHSDEESLGLYSLSECVRRGGERHAKKAARDSVDLVLPPESPEPKVFGSGIRLEQAAADLTEHALREVSPGDTVDWKIQTLGMSGEASLSWTRVLGGAKGERLFTLARGLRGEPGNSALFLARWAIESHGGTLTAEAHGDRTRIKVSIPVAREP